MILEPNSEMMALSAMVVLRSSNSPTVAHSVVACLSSRCENNIWNDSARASEYFYLVRYSAYRRSCPSQNRWSSWVVSVPGAGVFNLPDVSLANLWISSLVIPQCLSIRTSWRKLPSSMWGEPKTFCTFFDPLTMYAGRRPTWNPIILLSVASKVSLQSRLRF
jgi:hypothetical protein